jgi:hypothetical protein
MAIFDDTVDLQCKMRLERSRSGLAKPMSANTLPLLFSKVIRVFLLVAIINCSFAGKAAELP